MRVSVSLKKNFKKIGMGILQEKNKIKTNNILITKQ